ncbi:hypothetical protein ACP70R_030491 [Stipagrostis hirtigluma subsp. patula]
MAAPTPVLSMKLLVDTKARRVLFAEAGKDVVHFLFSLLALPVAAAVALVGKEAVAGSVGSLCASVERLDNTYVLPGAAKGALLYPPIVPSPAATATNPLLPRPRLLGSHRGSSSDAATTPATVHQAVAATAAAPST